MSRFLKRFKESVGNVKCSVKIFVVGVKDVVPRQHFEIVDLLKVRISKALRKFADNP